MKEGLKQTRVSNPGHGSELVAFLSQCYNNGSGLFADVKLVCGDGTLWAHAATLAAVSPVLRSLLLDHLASPGNGDGATLLMPGLTRRDLKVVLDYVYHGRMTLRAEQMADVIGVMEVLHLKCGVSVSKRQHSECDWEPDRVMAFSPDAKDTKDKAAFLSDLAATKASFHPTAFNDATLPPMKLGLASPTTKDATEMETEEDRVDTDSAPPSDPPSSTQPGYKGLSLSKIPKDPVPNIPEESVVEVSAGSSDDEDDEDDGVHVVAATTEEGEEDGAACEENTESTTANRRNSKPDSPSQGSEANVDATKADDSSLKCVMCGKTFVHGANLRQHLKTHLGAKAQLKSCQICDRTFRSTTEHDLHASSHKFSRLLGFKRPSREVRSRSRLRGYLVQRSLKVSLTKGNRGDLYRRYISRMHQLEKEREERKRVRREQREEEKRQRVLAEEEAAEALKTPQQTSFLKDLLEGSGDSHSSQASKVKLKIKVDPSRFKAAPTSSPSPVQMTPPPMSAPPSVLKLSIPAGVIPSTRPESPAASPTHFDFKCDQCPKSFQARSSWLRHVRSKHGLSPAANSSSPSTTSAMPKTSGLNRRNSIGGVGVGGKRKKPSTSFEEVVQQLAKAPRLKLSLSRCDAFLSSQSDTLSSPANSPSSRRPSSSSNPAPSRRPSTSGSTSGGPRRSSEQDMQCPTCDKVFLAKSIYDRHLKTSKHGPYQATEEPSTSEGGFSPHMNAVLQPTIEVGGKEVAKYECHLCSQVFLRVKDLAKHRERMMCTAWK